MPDASSDGNVGANVVATRSNTASDAVLHNAI